MGITYSNDYIKSINFTSRATIPIFITVAKVGSKELENKMKKITNLLSLAILSLTQVANAAEATPTYHLECASYTRTHVTKTKIAYNEGDNYLSFDFSYDHKHFDDSPEAIHKVFQHSGGQQYPIVSEVTVINTKDDLLIKAQSEIKYGRAPHHQEFELFLQKYGENHYFAGNLILNSVDYSDYVGACSFVTL